MGPNQHRADPVDEGDGELTGRQEQDDSGQAEQPPPGSIGMGLVQENAGQAQREQGDRSGVAEKGMAATEPPQRLLERELYFSRLFETGQALIDEIKPHMLPGLAFSPRNSIVCEPERAPCYLHFGYRTCLGQPLHHMPVLIPAGEVHTAVYAVRILPQCLLDDAGRFDEIAPVDCT